LYPLNVVSEEDIMKPSRFGFKEYQNSINRTQNVYIAYINDLC
jgi:hypothetical protein